MKADTADRVVEREGLGLGLVGERELRGVVGGSLVVEFSVRGTQVGSEGVVARGPFGMAGNDVEWR